MSQDSIRIGHIRDQISKSQIDPWPSLTLKINVAYGGNQNSPTNI